MKHVNSRKYKKGFTLIETLISISVFAVGSLGIAVLNGNALKVSSSNYSRATALNSSRQVMNNFFVAAIASETAFQTALNAFDDNGSDSYAFTQTVANQNIMITIVAVEDNTGVNLLTTGTAPGTWISPFTMSVNITYAGVGDTDTGNDITTRASYTFVI